MRAVVKALTVAAVMLVHQPAWAQALNQAQDETIETRPASPTYWGDTGLWFVPTAETPRKGGMTFSLYRSEFDYSQGFSNVSYWPITASFAVGDRVEVFGALRMITRIDRDSRPLFFSDPAANGGLLNDYPFVHEQFTGNDLGDLFAGGKLNLASQSRNQTMGMALRGTLKFPTADDESGAGSGKFDFFGDAIVSKEINERVEVTGFGGVVFRTDPDQVSVSDSLRWGVGAGFNTRSRFRITTELWGEQPFDDAVQLKGTVPTVAADGSIIPVLSPIASTINTNVGLTFHAAGLVLGAGVTYHIDLDKREDANPSNENVTGDAVSLQFRIGFHSGVKTYRAPAPEAAIPPPAPAPERIVVPGPPAPVANRPPILLAVCDPCQIQVGRTIALRATGQDADGDRLVYRWTVPAGTITDAAAAVTNWNAPTVPGRLVLSVTADDGRGGVTTGQVNVEVVAAPVGPLTFNDILFDFNRDNLRPDSLAILQTVTAALRANPALRLQIEGHTSAEGTAEFNLALGERRAMSVRAYLISQGIDGSRLATVTYGEEQPRFADGSEASRALNRRAAFVVQGQ